MSNEITDDNKVKKMIDSLVEKAKKASEEYLKLDQEQVNNIVKAMSMAGLEHHMELAKMAVEDAKLDLESIDPVRAGVCVGSGIGGMVFFVRPCTDMKELINYLEEQVVMIQTGEALTC